MKAKKVVICAVLVIIGLPVVLVLIGAVSIYFLNRTNGTIVSSGKKREYLLYVPRSYDRAKPKPLVISLHGALLWPAAQMGISEWNRVADEHGFIVVYPSGTGALLKIWPMKPEADLIADVRFISELIDTLEAAYNIDPTRIYVNGASNGGAMAYALSCRLSHRIAAVGTVTSGQVPWSWCADSRPVPMIVFHGTADPIVPYNGGPRSRASPKPFPSVSKWAAIWARRNRCGPNPIESMVAADVTRLEYTGCADDATVVLYTLRGGGHTWPVGRPMRESAIHNWLISLNSRIVGPTSRNIDATSQMWTFFSKYQLLRK